MDRKMSKTKGSLKEEGREKHGMKKVFAKDPGSKRSSWRSEQSEDKSSGVIRDLGWSVTVSISKA